MDADVLATLLLDSDKGGDSKPCFGTIFDMFSKAFAFGCRVRVHKANLNLRLGCFRGFNELKFEFGTVKMGSSQP